MPVVGIGASAGGVEALRQFFDALPEDSGMAFVVILHLAPDYESNLAAILQKHTDMTVTEAETGAALQTNHVYVIPPARRLTVEDGHLHLTEITGRHEVSTIDRFFRSLAEDQEENAVGIVLSGTGTDGTVGLRDVKERGGITMAQAPDEAEHEDMPLSAVSTGMVDLVRPVKELAEKLVEYRNSAGLVQLPEVPEALDDGGRSVLQKIFTQLYTTTGHDFSNYKRSMVLRRLERRMQLNSCRSLEDYLGMLRESEAETQRLYRDLLISVTSFFRDAEAFDALEEQVIPKLFEGKEPSDQVRVWVPGCATGEEAYSLAMLLVEYADHLDHPPELQIFATDVDEEALQVGREGLYPEPIRADLTPERLDRFFEPKNNHYQISQRLRERMLFAKHNLLADPPFSNLDLVSCRNLLIYLDEDLQQHVFNLLHYGLNENGYLFLGRSEAGSRASRLFSHLDRANNILQARVLPNDQRERIPSTSRVWSDVDVSHFAPTQGGQGGGTTSDPESEPLETLHHRVLMQEVAGVLVNENHEIVHLTDRAGQYLEFEGGAPSHDLLDCVPEALRPELRSALYQAFKKGKAIERRELPLPDEDTTRHVTVVVHPVQGRQNPRYAHVQFQERTEQESSEASSSDTDRETELREELDRTREQLQTTNEEYEAATEEMEAANEELLSMNEELQSKNEELETSKEELQSLNEELKTTNQELKTKIEELRETNSVLENLMAATDIATLFLDRQLRIERYTPRVTELFNIQPMDVGRPLADFTQRFEYDGLIDDATMVLDELTSVEREIHQSDDRWFLLRLRPYRTVEDKIDGVVLTFVDITQRREAERSLRESQARLDAFVTATSDVIYRMSPDWSEMYYLDGRSFIVDTEEPRQTWLEEYIPENEQPRVTAAIAEAIDNKHLFELEHQVVQADGGRGWVYSRAVPILDEDGELAEWFGTATDITEKRELEAVVVDASEKVRRQIGQDLHDVLSSDLAALAMKTDNLTRKMDEESIERAAAVETLREIVEGLRAGADHSRTLSHALIPVALQEEHLAAALDNLCREQDDVSDLTLIFEGDREEPLPAKEETAMHLYRIAHEALTNARRHAQAEHVWISLRRTDDDLVLTVRDDGVGLSADDLEASDGVGLRTMEYRADIIGAAVSFEEGEAGGMEVRCTLPLERAQAK
jgi:two-component system CheB/CheR fusion protein